MMKRGFSIAAVAASLVVAPAFAMAVSVSSNDGNGSQYRVGSLANGADVSGNLRSTAGRPVYYQGKVNYSFPCGDDSIGRYTDNTTSTAYVTRGGRISGQYGFGCDAPRVNSRVARAITAAPDPVGSYSSNY